MIIRHGLLLLVAFLFAGCASQPAQPIAAASTVQQKIAPALTAVAAKLEAGTAPSQFSSGNVRADAKGRIQVYVYMATVTADEVKTLQAHGLEDSLPSPALRVVQGWVKPEKLTELAALSFVTRITPPAYGHPR